MDFEEAHPGFFNRLKQDFPDLSETYQKICAFLRIDLTSKEIADLLYVSIAAVNKNRQRLRKKMNLEAEADLNEFLKKI
jgi:DNA-binding NarL/FixJ family response regulator